jgi:hypothetical protein
MCNTRDLWDEPHILGGVQKYIFIVSLEELSCTPLPCGAPYVFFRDLICCRWTFLFFSLLYKNDSLTPLLLVFQLLSLFFWFLYFVLGPFIEILFVFNFIFQSQFKFSIWSLFFLFIILFFGPFVKGLLAFNFIIQSKLMILYFSIWS